MSTQNPFVLRAAENYEKAAKQNLEKGDKAKATQMWERAADFYIQAQVFDKAIACLESSGLFEDRAIELLAVFEPKKVLGVLAQRGLQAMLALAHLHVQNREQATEHTSVFRQCWLAAEIPGIAKNRALQLLKGAILTTSWAQDEARVLQAVELALGEMESVSQRAKGSRDAPVGLLDDRALFLLIKIAVSGDLGLIAELGKMAVPSATDRTSLSPFQLRLLAPVYLYRGILLDTLLDSMQAMPALVRYAERYRTLFAEIKVGRPDDALENFVSVLMAEADRPNPKTPLNTWEDVERRFPHILYAQPEYLAAAVLWDQVWATRAGVQEFREWIAEARTNPEAQQWTEAQALFERITGHALFRHLAEALQAEVYQLGCTTAFQAEMWEQYDQWAAILEEKYGRKDVLHQIITALPNAG